MKVREVYRMQNLLACGLACLGSAFCVSATRADEPPFAEPPRELVDTTYQPPTGGTTHVVSAGGNIQAAIDQAAPGDIIELEAGATWNIDRLVLPDKGASSEWIYIRSSAHASLPAPGNRVRPADVVNMPTLQNTGDDSPVFVTSFGAHHYRLVGIHLATTTPATNLVILGRSGLNWGAKATSISQLPTDITFDRCVMYGGGAGNRCERGVLFDVIRGAIVDSYIYAIKSGSDAQAAVVFNSPGPFKIVNNYLEATGENFMAGGADPRIQGLVPGDIEFRGNHCFKPMTWKNGHPSYAGYDWDIKNLFELKNARRVLVQGNVFQNNWIDAQSGFGILFTPRNQDGTADWSTVEDVTFIDNIIIDSARTWTLLGEDNNYPSQTLKRVYIVNNLARSGPEALFTHGRMEMITGDGRLPNEGFVFANNTIVHEDYNNSNSVASMTAWPGMTFTNANVTWSDNVLSHGLYGVRGSAVGSGTPAMDAYWDEYVFTGNVLFGSSSANSASIYPAGNHHPQSIADVQFVNQAAKDYRIMPGSPHHGKGADVWQLRSIEIAVTAGDASK